MKLKIKPANHEAFELTVESDATIESVQLEISKVIGLGTDHFKLSYISKSNKVIPI